MLNLSGMSSRLSNNKLSSSLSSFIFAKLIPSEVVDMSFIYWVANFIEVFKLRSNTLPFASDVIDSSSEL